MATTTEEKINKQMEQLLLRSMGAWGYLKIPYEFTKKFKYDKETVLDPEGALQETDDEVRLTYIWKKRAGKLVASDGGPSIRNEGNTQGK